MCGIQIHTSSRIYNNNFLSLLEYLYKIIQQIHLYKTVITKTAVHNTANYCAITPGSKNIYI